MCTHLKSLFRLHFRLILFLLFSASQVNAETMVLNFRDADIRAVIETVAEVSGRSFVLDPRVTGSVTVLSPAPIESDSLLDVLQSALQVQGFQAIDDGLVIRVIPLNSAFRTPDSVGGNSMVTEVISLHRTKAADVATLSKGMLSNGAVVRGFDDGNYLVVTDTQSQINRLREVLQKIDRVNDDQVELVQLENIDAGEALHMASQLSYLEEKGLKIVEDSYNNRLVLTGSADLRQQMIRFLKAVDKPGSSIGGIEVVHLNFADAESVKEMLEQIVNGGGAELPSESSIKLSGNQRYTIQADASANSVLISASPSLTVQLKRAIELIDQPKQQVLIEGVLAEISEDQASRLSAQVAVLGRESGGALVRFDNLIPALLGLKVSQNNDDLTPIGVGAAFTQIEKGLTGGVGTTWNNGENGIGVLVQALRSDANTNILSTPSIVTLNNEEALITVGQEVPFITGNYTNTNNNVGNPFQTIERQEVGVKLRVVPRISSAGSVQLKIEQEASNVLATALQAGTADVVTAKRSILTNVSVNDGQFLILGGLIDETTSNDRAKVPLLGDVPLLGNLFKSRSESGKSRVLMMFIKPTVLGSVEHADAVSRGRYEHLRIRQISGLTDTQSIDGKGFPEDPSELTPSVK